MRRIVCAMAVLVCAACNAGEISYSGPTHGMVPIVSATVDRSKDDLWGELIPALGSQFFIINNLDKESGLINVSFSGEPDSYLDCGWIKSTVVGPRGTRTYDNPVARGTISYQYFDTNTGTGVWNVQHNLSLEARANLIVEELGPRQTMVTVNTRFTVSRTVRSQNVTMRTFPSEFSESISFGTNETAEFSNSALGTSCRSTGKLERELLALIR